MQRKQTHKPRPNGLSQGFTIVELLIVIVIIAILVAIVTVSYNGIARQVKIASLKSDLKNASTQIELTNAKSGSYPTNEGQIDGDIKSSPNNTLSYKGGGTAYCVTATNTQANLSFSITHDGEITEGDCPFMSGGPMQLVTSDNCPTTRTLAVDARDNHTYWIQKLADGKCWMLTNLAYAGAGDNTYEDVIPTGDGITGLHGPDNDGIRTYTEAKYYIPPDANPTTIPQTPSVNSDGGVSESTRQFGYLYNWCAAMGNQQNTGACLEANKPTLSRFVSICPKNWRIPADTGAVNQFANLNNAVNSARWYTDTGLIDSPWLGQRGGYWNNGFSYQGDYGYYWAPFQDSGMFTAKYLSFGASHVYPINYSINKSFGLAVRCLLK